MKPYPARRRPADALTRLKTRWLAAVPAAAGVVLCATVATAAPFAYVTNGFAPSVSVVDTATNTVSMTISFPAGSVPFAMAMTPDLKKVYVTSLDSTSTCGPRTGVYSIDTATQALGANLITVGCEPTGIAITPDGLHVLVANQFNGTVSLIDTATDTVSKTITLGNGAPVTAIAITPDGGHAYVTGQSGVFVLDTIANTVLGLPIPAGTMPQGIGIAPDGKSVYVTDGALPGSGVTVIDVATGKALRAIAVGNNPSAVAITPDGKSAYVTNGGVSNGVFTVSVIDTATQAVAGSPIQVDSFPNAIAITADGKQAYVANEGGNTVSVIDTASNTVTKTVSGMNSPRGTASVPLPPGFPVPNYVGRPIVLVWKIIGLDGFTGGTVTKQSSALAPGVILSQQPAASGLAGRGGAIDFVIASGIAVPNVVGQTQAAATSAITAASLTVGTVTQQPSASVAPGSVISQNPAAGGFAAGGSQVGLVVSSGVAVPNVVGQTQAAATSAITAAGLTVGTVTQQSSSMVASGNLISQSPAAGTNAAGGSQVNLVVSSGSGGSGGGGGRVDLLTLGALLFLAIAGWQRRRSLSWDGTATRGMDRAAPSTPPS